MSAAVNPTEISRPAGGRHPLGRTPAAAIPGPTPPLEPLPDNVLADIVAGLAEATPLWSAAVRHDPDGRRPVRLIATDRYEVWVIGWTTGQHVRMHDHGGSAGAFVVTSGELSEVLPDGRGGRVERDLATGRLRHLAVGMVHDVVNRGAEPATSVHVYSPPLTHMTYYDDAGAPVETEDVPPELPMLAASAASRALHPARRVT
jgi:predicted metal-dependent enzyme (double-stranded beta helix superfamily)